MDIVCKVLTGSRLYGTARPDSDFDVRGCYLPSLRDCYQNQIKDVINTGPEELYYSVHKFLDLATTGQPIAIELLFAPNSHVEVSNQRIWNLIKSYRHEFLNKKMEAFLGFGRSLANKYAVKAERLSALSFLLHNLENYIRDWKAGLNQPISAIWDFFPLVIFARKKLIPKGELFILF